MLSFGDFQKKFIPYTSTQQLVQYTYSAEIQIMELEEKKIGEFSLYFKSSKRAA